jgi:hypothetical protein
VLSPLIFNVAMSALDERLHRPWKPSGEMATPSQRKRRRSRGLPNWRVVRYADDFVVLVHGTRADVEVLREEIADVLAPLGLRLSEAKTRIGHMSEGFDFLGFRVQWKRKMGTSKWYVYTFIADRPIRSLKAKIRALTNRTSQQDLRSVLIRLGQIMRGWASYFKHAVCKHTLANWQASPGGGWSSGSGGCIAGAGRTSAGHPLPLRGNGSRSQRTGSSYTTWKRSPSPGTATVAARSPAPGFPTTPDGRNRGEPGAQ